MTWRTADAKAKFSSLLDEAETEGPQVIRRRKQTFVLTTEAEIDKRIAEAQAGKRKKFISIWEALRVPPHARLNDEEFATFTNALEELRR